MIEFKGSFYRNKSTPSQSVLVQFDGVLLHIWHMSNPFHRILSSDVFDLPCAMGKKRRYIKLPNGGRIETDDIQALNRLQPNCSPWLPPKIQSVLPRRCTITMLLGTAVTLTAIIFAYWLLRA